MKNPQELTEVKPNAIIFRKCIVDGGPRPRFSTPKKKTKRKNVETRAAIGRGRFWDERDSTRAGPMDELFLRSIDRPRSMRRSQAVLSTEIFCDKEPLMNTRMKNADITGHGATLRYIHTYICTRQCRYMEIACPGKSHTRTATGRDRIYRNSALIFGDFIRALRSAYDSFILILISVLRDDSFSLSFFISDLRRLMRRRTSRVSLYLGAT